MKRWFYSAVVVVAVLSFGTAALSVPVVYDDEVLFRADAGSATTYGFEVHGLIEDTDYSGSSPILASDLDNHFDLAFTGLNLFEIFDNAASPGIADGTHAIFTHSIYPGDNYTLTFSNLVMQHPFCKFAQASPLSMLM